MDLSIKRPAPPSSPPQELPQDLSVKKPRVSEDLGTSGASPSSELKAKLSAPPVKPTSPVKRLPAVSLLPPPFNTNLAKASIPPPDMLDLLKETLWNPPGAVSLLHSQVEKSLRALSKPPDARTSPGARTPPGVRGLPGARPAPDAFSRSADGKSKVDGRSKRITDKSPKSSPLKNSGQYKAHNSAVGVHKSTDLVVPKHTALIVPNPRSRMQGDQKNRSTLNQAASADVHKNKPSGIDGSKSLLFPHGVNHSRSLVNGTQKSHSLNHHRKSIDMKAIEKSQMLNGSSHLVNGSSRSIEIQAMSYLPTEMCSNTIQAEEDDAQSSKRNRRKQVCPRKRIKTDADSCSPEDDEEEIERPETTFAISDKILNSEDILNKVTDLAQNGELSRGLDAIFGETALRCHADVTGSDDADDDAALSSSASPNGGSPAKVTQNGKKKEKAVPAQVSPTSLQNREKRKRLRLYGQAYTTPSGKVYPQRKVQEKDCSKCRYNCSSNITFQQRLQIFEHFWSLDSYVKRLFYYCQSIKEKPAKTMKHTRECSREYTFRLDTGEKVRVCKGFYLATLDVSDKAVRIAMEKRKRGKGLTDKKAIHSANSKARPEEKDRVRHHIECLLIADIYAKTGDCDSSDVIPGQDLDVIKMYEDYVKECAEERREALTEDVYRDTFETEYNLTTVQV